MLYRCGITTHLKGENVMNEYEQGFQLRYFIFRDFQRLPRRIKNKQISQTLKAV